MNRTELRRLAKTAGIPGWYDKTVAELRDALDFGADASDVAPLTFDPPPSDPVTPEETAVTNGNHPDLPPIPGHLRRELTPAEKVKVDRLIRDELYGDGKKWIMGGSTKRPIPPFADAPSKPVTADDVRAAQARRAATSGLSANKMKGTTCRWVWLHPAATDAEAAALTKPLPKQARAIADFVRSEGSCTLDHLVERGRHFLKTKQEPARIVSYYRAALISAGLIKLTYDDASVPEVTATNVGSSAVVERLDERGKE